MTKTEPRNFVRVTYATKEYSKAADAVVENAASLIIPLTRIEMVTDGPADDDRAFVWVRLIDENIVHCRAEASYKDLVAALAAA